MRVFLSHSLVVSVDVDDDVFCWFSSMRLEKLPLSQKKIESNFYSCYVSGSILFRVLLLEYLLALDPLYQFSRIKCLTHHIFSPLEITSVKDKNRFEEGIERERTTTWTRAGRPLATLALAPKLNFLSHSRDR